MNSILSFQNVTKTYGSVAALKGISFDLRPREIVAVIGANGAGKSTMMNMASGLIGPTEGQVQILGMNPNATEVKRLRRTLPQELRFPKHLRVNEILELVSAHYKSKVSKSFIDRLGIRKLLNRMTTELSGGELRKIGILCGLIGAPKLVLFDEPTANVDLLGQAAIREILLEYFKAYERSFFFSSHSMQEVEMLADRVIVLLHGKIVVDSPTKDLKSLTKLKKVLFRSENESLVLKSANRIIRRGSECEALGINSDEILRELVSKDSSACHFDISNPTLEESILNIWSGESV